MRYLSGPKGVITRKLEMSTGAAVLFVGSYMFILGTQNQIWHVKDYISILLAQWDATIAKRSDGCVLVTDSRPVNLFLHDLIFNSDSKMVVIFYLFVCNYQDACFLDIPRAVLPGVLGQNLMT